MKFTSKFNLSRFKQEKHFLSTDSNDNEKNSSSQSFSFDDSVSSFDYSSEEKDYENFQKNLYAMIKKRKRQIILKKIKSNDSDLENSSSFEDKKKIMIKTRKVKKFNVRQKVKFKTRVKKKRIKEAKQTEKRMKKNKDIKAKFIRVDRL